MMEMMEIIGRLHLKCLVCSGGAGSVCSVSPVGLSTRQNYNYRLASLKAPGRLVSPLSRGPGAFQLHCCAPGDVPT